MVNKADIQLRMLMGPGPSDDVDGAGTFRRSPSGSGGDGHAAPRVPGYSVL